jgi:hypothetical protein
MIKALLRRYVPGAILALGATLLVAGCAGLKTDYQIARERAEAYVASRPDLEPDVAEAIRNNRVLEGMTMEQVVAAWGPPAYVRRFRDGQLQQWFFGCGWPHICTVPGSRREAWAAMAEDYYLSRVIFEDGRVTHFQS